MAIQNTTGDFYASAQFTSDLGSEAASFIVEATLVASATSPSEFIPEMTAVVSLTADASVTEGLKATSATGSFLFRFRGNLKTETRKIYLSQVSSGTVNNIEDLPASPSDGTVYNVLGTSPNREPVFAVYSSLSSSWYYQLAKNTTKITYINPMIGTNVVMPNYINYEGTPHTPVYWSKNVDTGGFTYHMEAIEVTPSVPGSGGNDDPENPPPPANKVWRWMVEDLADPGTGKYALNSWPAHGGQGPTWKSKEFYRPQVKGTVKFNIKKNKTRKQRSVVFNNHQVDHIYMTCAALPQPFTVVIVGIIHSYPTAKFGHYLLDSGKEPPIFNANKTGKDFFFSEGTNPRNVMLFQKKRARIAVNTQPGKDLKVIDKNIKSKHTEKARPRFFYGVFNGNSSRIGAMDTKYKFDQTGQLSNHGGSTYFSMGRRVNRISDNRASVMSIWDITFFHRALSHAQLTGYYQEMASKYHFKEFT